MTAARPPETAAETGADMTSPAQQGGDRPREVAGRDVCRAELAAAKAILADAAIPASLAKGHLDAAVRAGPGSVAMAPLATDERRALVRHVDELERWLAGQAQSVCADPRLRWLVRGSVGAAGTAVLVAVWIAFGGVIGAGQWRGRYFPSPDFSGEPVVRRDRDIDFNWQRRRPLPAVANNHKSIRWDTCMRLWAPRNLRFQVIANQQVRLRVDGAVVVDEAGGGRDFSAGGAVALAPGWHHVELEYSDRDNKPRVVLRASINGRMPVALSPDRLAYPRDGDTPCPP